MRLSGRIFLGRLAGWQKWLWPVLSVVLVIAFIIAVVRPFAAQPEPRANDVAAAWNDSISRLGILPVFPPEEDLHVGDLWGVIAGDTDETPLLGKAVRLTHVDLRDLMLVDRKNQPIFPDTVAIVAGDPFRNQARNEVATFGLTDPISLTLTAFPGITIRHSRRATGSLLARSLGGIGAAREGFELEEIRIPVAETYGVDAPAAVGRLDAWCSAPASRLYCSDEFVRRVMAFAVSDRVMTVREERYVVQLQLQLVTRVFLTREIEQSRVRDDSTGATARAQLGRTAAASSTPVEAEPAAPPAEGQAPETAEAHGRAALSARDATNNAALNSRSTSAAALLSRADGTEIAVRQIFQRPVVFGYRAVTVTLTPATPLKGLSR